MSALHVDRMSDILPATGKAGMQEASEQRLWNWRRGFLAVGYGFVFLTGLLILATGDPNGPVLMAAAVVGIVFLHRTWFGVAVWIYVLASGGVALISGDDTGFWGVAAGLGFGLLALPWPKGRARRQAYYWPTQSPFVVPPRPQSVALTTPVAPTVQTVAVTPPAPMIRTIGRIQLLTAAGDLTPNLMGKPVIGFLWLYLLARSVVKPGDRLTRASITDEVAHGVSDPRGRLRSYLRDLLKLPQPIGSMVKVEDEMIGFDLGQCDADFVRLDGLATRLRQGKSALDGDALDPAQSLLLELGGGEFLPGFEDMEKRATGGRGIAGQVVAQARSQIDTMRADVADVVANALLDRGQATAAVALLDPIVARAEERDDVARTLMHALRESGQLVRAADVRRRFAVGQES